MVRVRLQAGVMDALHLRLFLEELRHAQAVLVVATDAQVKGFHAADQQGGIVGATVVLLDVSTLHQCEELPNDLGRLFLNEHPPGQVVSSFAEGKAALKSGKINYDGASSVLDFDARGDVKPDFGVYVFEKGKMDRKYVVKI